MVTCLLRHSQCLHLFACGQVAKQQNTTLFTQTASAVVGASLFIGLLCLRWSNTIPLAPMWCAQAPRWCQRPRPSQSAVPCETLAWQTHSQTLLHSWQGACALCMCAVPSSSSRCFNTSCCCLQACWQASRCCCALCQTCSSTQLGGVHAACVQARVRLQAHAGVCAPSHDHTHKMASDVAAGNATSVCNRKALLPACQSMQTAQLHACSRSFITLLVEQHGWQWQTARGLLAISAACGQKHASRWCLCLARFPKAVVPMMKASWHKRTATGCWWCQLASSDTKSSTRCS